MKLFRKTREQFIVEGMLTREFHFGIWMEVIKDRNRNFCLMSKPRKNYFGREVKIVRDTENPVTHYFNKWFDGRSLVSEWEFKKHPEWFEYKNV